jgi:enamine deaminase RidA (YjgF/YER057c/UK114 family)
MINNNARRMAALAAAAMAGAIFSCASLAAAKAPAEPAVVRLPLEGSDFPISAAVTVSKDADTYFLSGALPPVINKDAAKGSVDAYGNMETQTTGALNAIKGTLARLGLTMGDVIKMTVFMAPDPSMDNKMNFAGLMAGYTKFFATAEQPNKPARSAVMVAGLAAPGALVEIEVIAAKARH